MNEDQYLIEYIKLLAWNPINAPSKIKTRGGENEKREEKKAYSWSSLIIKFIDWHLKAKRIS